MFAPSATRKNRMKIPNPTELASVPLVHAQEDRRVRMSSAPQNRHAYFRLIKAVAPSHSNCSRQEKPTCVSDPRSGC